MWAGIVARVSVPHVQLIELAEIEEWVEDVGLRLQRQCSQRAAACGTLRAGCRCTRARHALAQHTAGVLALGGGRMHPAKQIQGHDTRQTAAAARQLVDQRVRASRSGSDGGSHAQAHVCARWRAAWGTGREVAIMSRHIKNYCKSCIITLFDITITGSTPHAQQGAPCPCWVGRATHGSCAPGRVKS